MGVPELLKFAAKSCPGALCRVPTRAAAAQDNNLMLHFDFVLIDATNVLQTFGGDVLLQFFEQRAVSAASSVIFVLDSQRRRQGTQREQRTHNVAVDVEVSLRSTASALQEMFRKQGASTRVMLSGRDVAGEADYKMLHMQRMLVASYHTQKKASPTFLMISEDSDVLCGALCGPAPHLVSLGTMLRDTTSQLHVLRLTHVLAYLGQCADVLLYETHDEEEAVRPLPSAAPIAAPVVPQQQQQQQQQQPSTTAATVKPTVEAAEGDEDEETIVRRKRKDGPMISTGTKVKLGDDSDDEDEDVPVRNNNNHNSNKVVDAAPVKSVLPTATTPHNASNNNGGGVPSALPPLSQAAKEAANYLHSVCVDFVFLFSLLMGNGSNVAPLAKGTTKVDLSHCWQTYCQRKYSKADRHSEPVVRSLLTVTTGPKKNELKAYMKLDCQFLLMILQDLKYADPLSRPPLAEEHEKATSYLQQAIASVVRHTVAAHVSGATGTTGGPKQHSSDEKSFLNFLDSRRDSLDENVAPTLSALLATLANEPQHTFLLPIRGEIDPKPMPSPVVLQNDVDSNLVLLTGRQSSSSTSLMLVAGVQQWKTLGSFVEEATRALPSALGIFERIDAFWCLTLANGIAAIQRIARATLGHLRKGTSKAELKKLQSAAAAAAAANAKQAVGYSFELRRMTPVLSQQQREDSSSSAAPSTASTASRVALLQAAGISLSYMTAPPVEEAENVKKPTAPPAAAAAPKTNHKPQNATKGPSNNNNNNNKDRKSNENNAVTTDGSNPKKRSATPPTRENDQNKKPKRERPAPTTSVAETTNDHTVPSAGAAKTSDGKEKEGGTSTFRRLGKKERQKLKKANEAKAVSSGSHE